MEENAYSRKRNNVVGIVLTAVTILVAGILAWIYIYGSDENPLSEEAIVGADVVNIASTVPGRIKSISVKENQFVKEGDELFTIDPEPLRIMVEQAKADLELSEAAVESERRTVAAESQNALMADGQVTRARTSLDLAAVSLKRLEALSPKGYVPRQQVDDARKLYSDAQVGLQQAINQAKAANSLISTLESGQALVRARQAALNLAQYNLENSIIRAPNEGRIVGVDNSPGQIVISGQSVFTLINTSSWYVSGTFRETELDKIKIGNCATIRILADNSTVIKGTVDGVGWGVSSEEIISVPRNLPYVPKSLKWVRIAQRFPVRIKLINPPEDLVRIGASAVVTVHNGKKC